MPITVLILLILCNLAVYHILQQRLFTHPLDKKPYSKIDRIAAWTLIGGLPLLFTAILIG